MYPRVLSLASLRRPPYRSLSAAVSSSAPTNAPPPTHRPPTPRLPPAAPPFSSATPPRYPPSSHIHLTTRRHRQVTQQHPPVLLTFPLLIASPTARLHARRPPPATRADCPPKAQLPPAHQPPSCRSPLPSQLAQPRRSARHPKPLHQSAYQLSGTLSALVPPATRRATCAV